MDASTVVTFKVGSFPPAMMPQLTVREHLLDLHAGASDFVVDFVCDSAGGCDAGENEAEITIGDELLRLMEQESKDILGTFIR